MKDINGKEIRPGQRVRHVMEGAIQEHNGLFYVRDDAGVMWALATSTYKAPLNIEVLAEPRIPEPMTVGSVIRDASGTRWVRVVASGGSAWMEICPVYDSGACRWDWQHIVDPVLLHEGWTGDV